MIKVFYVEDEPFLAKIVKETLEDKGFEVIHIDNGDDAVSEYENVKPDICVLDIMLPKINGYQIANHIRRVDKWCPILFLSAKNQTEDLAKGFESGGNDYIKKPFSIDELILRIHNLLSLTNSKSKTSNLMNIGPFITFNSESQTLCINGESTQVSFKECQVLNLLCEHKNQVLNRKKILMDVWNDDSHFNSRILDVYIRKLRKVLSVDDSVQIITLKGVGYKFNTT